MPVKGPKVTWFDQNLQEMPNFRSARYDFGTSSSTQVRRTPRRVESTTTSQFEATSAYGNSFQVTEDQLPGHLDPSCLEERVDAAQSMLRHLGFTSAWDLVLAIVEGHSSQSTKDCADQFFTADCAEKLINYVLPQSAPDPLCAASSRVYKAEWDNLQYAHVLTQELKPSNLSQFDFGRMYQEMQMAAPNLVGLFNHLSNPTTTSLAAERSRQRYVVIALAQLAHRNNSNVNYIQTMIGLHLYASNVPKRIFPALNHLGISVSDSTTRHRLEKAAEEQRRKLRGLGEKQNSFIIVFDNLNTSANVRYMRVTNEKSQINYTAGFVLVPPKERVFFLIVRCVRYSLRMYLRPHHRTFPANRC